MTSNSRMSHPPGWRRPLVRQRSPAGSSSPCMWLQLHQQVWSRAQEGRQSYGHQAQEASLISWVSRRAQDEASVCGTPGKAGQRGPAAPQFPTLGTRMQAAVRLCPTIAFVLLLRQERGNRPPPPQPHVTPQTAHPVPPLGWQLTSGSRCILCPAAWSGGGTGGRLQISWLLTALVILSTPWRRRGLCLTAWRAPLEQMALLRELSYTKVPTERGGESDMARWHLEPCLVPTPAGIWKEKGWL